jgi:hypothetical protein
MVLILDYFALSRALECPKLSISHGFKSDPAERDASPKVRGTPHQRPKGKQSVLKGLFCPVSSEVRDSIIYELGLARLWSGLISGQAIRFTNSDLGICPFES